jgi:hypothetical protein
MKRMVNNMVKFALGDKYGNVLDEVCVVYIAEENFVLNTCKDTLKFWLKPNKGMTTAYYLLAINDNKEKFIVYDIKQIRKTDGITLSESDDVIRFDRVGLSQDLYDKLFPPKSIIINFNDISEIEANTLVFLNREYGVGEIVETPLHSWGNVITSYYREFKLTKSDIETLRCLKNAQTSLIVFQTEVYESKTGDNIMSTTALSYFVGELMEKIEV